MNSLYGNTFKFDTRNGVKNIIFKTGPGQSLNIDSSLTLNSRLTYIYTKNDFPTPDTSGKIVLEDNRAYVLLGNIDLQGNRLVCGQNNVIDGISSENCSLTSTGLDSNTPFISSIYTILFRNITIENVGTLFDLDGQSTGVIDWTAFNINNVPTIGTIANYNNVIILASAWLNSGGLTFEGSFGTIGLEGSFFLNTSNYTIITIPSTTTISRRFKISESSFVVINTGIALDVDSNTTIPNQGYIINNCNFSGGSSTYLVGLKAINNKSSFFRNEGIENSRSVGGLYLSSSTSTTIVLNTWTKLLGTTTINSSTSKFNHTNNRLTYIGSITQIFDVIAGVSLSGSNGDNVDIGISINGNDPTVDTIVSSTMDSGGKINFAGVPTFFQLQENDYIEIWVRNTSSSNNVTATSINLVCKGNS